MRRSACCPIFLIFLSSFSGAFGWFQEELELFDLVEEVGENFYTVMQVSPDANNADLKKAFRKLSLSLHPDKNDAPDASVKFRQMVAVYEVLKDTERRRRYDQVLRDGLPDWRQPMFYFRRARKMGFGELFVFLGTLLTVGHYLMSWGSYLEKCWEFSEMRQKRKKKKGKGKYAEVEDDLEEDMFELHKPGWRNLLPLLMVKHSYWFFKSMPDRYEKYQERKRYLEEVKRREEEEAAAAAAEPVVREPRPKKKRVYQFPDFESMPGRENMDRREGSDSEAEETPQHDERSGGLWTDEDLVKLGKMMRKYPGAVPGRWEIIARQMQRTVFEVTFMANRIKKGGTAANESSLVALQSEASHGHQLLPTETILKEENSEDDDEQDGVSVQYAQKPDEYMVAEKKKKQKHKAPDLAPVSTKPWSQMQQEALEKALHKYTKGVDERWEKIANCVPGKTKEECLERCRELAKNVKKRKEEKEEPGPAGDQGTEPADCDS